MSPEENSNPESQAGQPPAGAKVMVNELAPTPNETLKTSRAKNKRSKQLIIIVGIVLLLLGASAAAYIAVIKPNQPGSLLKAGIENTLQKKQLHIDTTANFESTNTKKNNMPTTKVHVLGQADLEKNVSQAIIDVTASGVNFPFEVRMVDENLYVKVGDLGTIKNLVSQTNRDAGTLVGQFANKLSNKWIVIDSTLLNQANTSCDLGDMAFTKEDIQELIKSFEKYPFASIISTGEDSVNGQPATKFEIDIDDNKGVEYLEKLPDLSFFKKLRDCSGGELDQDKAFDGLADNDHTPLTIWVDKTSKQIVKIAGHTTAQDEQKDYIKGTIEATLSYDAVSVTKPDGAKPIMELLGDFGSLFGLTGNSALGNSTVPGISQECLQAYQAYASSGGTSQIPDTCQ
jgi:hypothetical protein